MKTNRILGALPLVFAATALSVSPILAADAPTSSSAPGGANSKPSTTTSIDDQTASEGRHHHRHHHGFLSKDEKAQLKAAREKAFKANPELKSEFEAMKTEHQEMRSKWKSHGEKMREAMLKADPTLKPLFDKMDARRKEWKAKFEAEHPDFKHDSD